MSKARDLANSVATGGVLADGVVSLSEVGGGTNNGVVYVDGTGTTTSGSALTFDGSDLSLAGTVTATTFEGDGSLLTGVSALPDQTGNSGKYLTTDGTNPSWATLNTDGNTTTKGLYEMANTISTNYTIGTGNNAVSAGPITVNSGITVTVPTGSRWVVV